MEDNNYKGRVTVKHPNANIVTTAIKSVMTWNGAEAWWTGWLNKEYNGNHVGIGVEVNKKDF